MASYLSVDDRNPELCVIDKFLGVGDVAELCARLKDNGTKKRLVLKGNCLGASGAGVLSEFLATNSSIETLSLEWNQLGNEGCALLAKSLSTCGVVELDLRNNNIKSEGAMAIAKAVMANGTITTIDLRWNQVEDNGVKAFKEAILDRVPKLQIKMSGNLLSADCARVLDTWLGNDGESLSENSMPNVGRLTETQRAIKREVTGPSAAAEAAQSTILQQETSLLRAQNTTLQGQLRDMQRQLDTSAVRVTELEQQFLKEEHRSNSLSEQLKTAHMRVTMQTEELKNLTESWEGDRQQHMVDMRRVVSERDEEVRTMCTEKDRAKAALQKAEDKAMNLQIQLDQLSRVTEQERSATQRELSSALQQVTDLTTSEARMRSENAVLKNADNRHVERQKQLESEIESTKRQCQGDLEAEFKARGEELDRVRAEFASQLSVAQEKAARQTRELAELYKKHAELQSEASTQRVELQEKSDAAIAAVRESEAKRCESTVAEFRARLDAYLSSRAATEVRCEGLARELKVAQEQHLSTSTQLEKQIKEMDAELRRLREQKLAMETSTATAHKDMNVAIEKAGDSHKRMIELEGRLEETRRSLHDCTLERGTLRSDNQTLKAQVDKLEIQRRQEFHSLSEHLSQSLKKELESLKSGYKIADPPETLGDGEGVSSTPSKTPGGKKGGAK